MMKPIITTLFIASLVFCTCGLYAAEHESLSISGEEAQARLQQGNQRFVQGERTYPHQDKIRLEEVAQGQNPFATVITCSDSRVPVEHLFDVGLGDVFTIRVAGNVCDTDEIGSIEYGVDHLGTPLLVVLGHSSCGAVTAVVQKEEVHGNIPQLVDNIIPAVEKARHDHPDLDAHALIAECVKYNVQQAIDDLLQNSESIRERLKSGKVRIVGAVYHLDTGKVEWIEPKTTQVHVVSPEKKKMTHDGFIHIVFFWLNDGVSEERKQQLIADCRNYLGTVETVRKIEVGIPAGTPRDVVDNSYAVSIVLYFDGKEGQDYYQKAEKHLQFIERNQDIWKRVQVYDMIPK